MHHQLRTHRNFGTLDVVDKGLLKSLTAAQDEGLADFIDKRVELTQSTDTADSNYHYRWLLRPAPAVIHQIDSAIQVLAVGGAATPERFYRRLTNGTNGHLPGFYIAYTILQNGLLKPLLNHADDPIAFALLYQKPAKKDELHQHPPTFSPASVRYLQALERRYAKPRKAT